MYFKVFSFTVLICSVYGIISGNSAECASAIIDGAGSAVTLLLSLAGMICFWNGCSEILKSSRLPKLLAKVLHPVTRLILPADCNEKARENTAMLLCFNLLGLGNAATPLALKAMKEFDSTSQYPSDGAVMLCLSSCAPPSILPMTILAMLKNGGCENPFAILPDVWICSSLSFCFSIMVGQIYCRIRRGRL